VGVKQDCSVLRGRDIKVVSKYPDMTRLELFTPSRIILFEDGVNP